MQLLLPAALTQRRHGSTAMLHKTSGAESKISPSSQTFLAPCGQHRKGLGYVDCTYSVSSSFLISLPKDLRIGPAAVLSQIRSLTPRSYLAANNSTSLAIPIYPTGKVRCGTWYLWAIMALQMVHGQGTNL